MQKFNDLPAAYQSNIDKQLPLDGRAPGSTPPMSEQNIADLLCFLKTLTDGYTPPASRRLPGLVFIDLCNCVQCVNAAHKHTVGTLPSSTGG